MHIDCAKLKDYLYEKYTEEYPESARLQRRGSETLIDGGSHAIRLIDPFPPRITGARGGFVRTEGRDLLDFWQGHHANILGHNPPLITETLAEALQDGMGLQTGFTDELQIETAEVLCRALEAEAVRFTTSGALATMYATLLSRAFTGREMVLKIGGGWHGAQPWGLKGIDFHGEGHIFNEIDTEGLSGVFGEEVLITRFNDSDMLERVFREFGNKIACFIIEPFIGAGGFIAASKEYIQTARRLTEQYGTVLIFDEVIDGFRFGPGSIGKHYGVRPDLGTYGKIIGGGMPIAAVAGRRDILNLAGRSGGRKVRFSGGTFSGHPAALLAGKTMMQYLTDRRDSVYPCIDRLGEKARLGAEKAFRDRGIYAYCTGKCNDAVRGSSMAMIFFPRKEGDEITTPEESRDNSHCQAALGEQLLQLALLLEGVHVVHGFGSVSAAHSEEDIDLFIGACERTADLFAEFRM